MRDRSTFDLKLSVVVLIVYLLFSYVSAHAATFRSGDEISVDGQFDDDIFATGSNVQGKIDAQDDAFFAGGEITVSGQSVGNAFLAGGEISVSQFVGKLLTTAGGELSFSRVQVDEALVAGGDIEFTASDVKDDLIVAGGKVRIDSQSKIEDDLVAAGGKIQALGSVGGDAVLRGDEIELAGTFQGSVDVEASKLSIAPGTVINGNLRYAVRDSKISSEAVIRGEQTRVERERGRGGFGKILAGLLFVIGLILVPPLIASAFPSRSRVSAEKIQSEPLRSLGLGFISLLLLPIVFVVVLMTVVGIPIALASLPFIFVLFMIAWASFVFTVGSLIRRARKKPSFTEQTAKQIFGTALIGSVVLWLVMLIPFIGALIAMLGFIAAVGAHVSLIRKPWGSHASAVE